MEKNIFVAFFLIVASTLTCGQDIMTDILEQNIFNQWLQQHNINVPLNADINKWKADVIAKFKELEAHNSAYRKGEKKFRAALNHLSHLTTAEKKAKLFGLRKTDRNNYQDQVEKVDRSLLKDLPDYWNWAEKGVVQDALNQGEGCANCYVMAGVAAIESHACIYNKVCQKLSELDVTECTPSGCQPGMFYEAFNFTITYGGLAAAKDYPYNNQSNPTNLNSCGASSRPRVPGTKVIGWRSMPNDAETMRYYLVKNGPMLVQFSACNNLVTYSGGIYDRSDNIDCYDHLVLLTGYGTENGVDYWIARNSWSKDYWGEKGFFRILRGVNLVEFESGYATYPIMDTSFTRK